MIRQPAVGLATVSILLVVGCAKELAPPGAMPDQVPPAIIEVRPFPGDVVPDFDGDLEVRFNEPVNLPNGIHRSIDASPMEVYVARIGFSSIRLRPTEGWRPDAIYCYTFPLRGISDLLRNQMEGSEQFCFSTGPPILETDFTGTIRDGLTGQPIPQGRVVVFSGQDSIPYGAVADDEGEFVMPAHPPGEYLAYGYLDQNRNLLPDFDRESYDSALVLSIPDTAAEAHFLVIPPDTTPPLFLRGVAFDSLTMQLEFDDYLRNPQPATPVILVRDSTGATEVAIVAEVHVGEAADVLETEPTGDEPSSEDELGEDGEGDGEGELGAEDVQGAIEDSAGMEEASLAGLEEAPPPGLEAVGDAEVEEGDEAVQDIDEDGTEADSALVLPSRFLTVLLDTGVAPGTYRVAVSSAVNVRHLVGGGDTTVVREEPEPDSAEIVSDSATAELDSAMAETDTTGIGADSLTAVQDSVVAEPDIGSTAADTVSASPDTVSVPPDTVSASPDTSRSVSRVEDRWARRARGPG